MFAALIDSMSASASVKAVSSTRTVSGATSRHRARNSVPVIPGIRWSLITSATGSAASRSSAASGRSARSTR